MCVPGSCLLMMCCFCPHVCVCVCVTHWFVAVCYLTVLKPRYWLYGRRHVGSLKPEVTQGGGAGEIMHGLLHTGDRLGSIGVLALLTLASTI